MTKFGPPHSPAYVCSHVFGGERPVLLVAHDDGDWQFLCGGDHGATELPRVIGVEHLVSRDSSLEEVADLPENAEAERTSPAAPWRRSA
jgi:hypothetical protein